MTSDERRSGPRLDGITYDFWNTIFAESPVAFQARLTANVAVLSEAGHDIGPDTMNDAMTKGWEWYRDRWERNVQTGPELAVRRLLDTLGVSVPDHVVGDLVDVIVEGSDPSAMTPAAGIDAAIEEWRRRGVRVGIICDVGITPSTTLRRYLDHHDLLDRFDHLTFSDDVGLYKPHPGVFESARRGLGLDEGAALAHVGDLVRTDIAGARDAGWSAVRYRGLRDDVEGLASVGIDAHHVIDDHLELLTIF